MLLHLHYRNSLGERKTSDPKTSDRCVSIGRVVFNCITNIVCLRENLHSVQASRALLEFQYSILKSTFNTCICSLSAGVPKVMISDQASTQFLTIIPLPLVFLKAITKSMHYSKDFEICKNKAIESIDAVHAKVHTSFFKTRQLLKLPFTNYNVTK